MSKRSRFIKYNFTKNFQIVKIHSCVTVKKLELSKLWKTGLLVFDYYLQSCSRQD